MSGQLRALKNRIRSISSTKKITRAMEMVSASKLKRYQKMVLEGAPYAEGLLQLLKRVGSGDVDASHPFLGDNDSSSRMEKKKALLVFTSDSGLCGSYNQELIATAQRFLKNEKETPILIGIGKMGTLALTRSGLTFEKTFTETKAAEIENTIGHIKSLVQDLFLTGRVDGVYATYSRFINAAKFQAVTEKILPFSLDSVATSSSSPAHSNDDYLMEPDAETLFERLVPAVFGMRIRRIFLESFVSEQMARMNAMHQATENASELIDELVLERNKARQAAITKELIEIISGSQALKA